MDVNMMNLHDIMPERKKIQKLSNTFIYRNLFVLLYTFSHKVWGNQYIAFRNGTNNMLFHIYQIPNLVFLEC